MGVSAGVDGVFSGIVLFAIAAASAFLLVERCRTWSGTSRRSCMWQLSAWLRAWRRGARAGAVVTELQDSESSGVREGGADADSANVLRLRRRGRQTWDGAQVTW